MEASETREVRTRELPIEKLREHSKYQNRKHCSGGLHADEKETGKHINELARQIKNNGLINPIEVYDIEGEYFVVNGFHRLAAVKSLGHSRIKCQITKGTTKEAWRSAMLANSSASVPLKPSQRIEVAWHAITNREYDDVRRELLAGKGNREVARLWSISEGTVRSKLRPVMRTIAAMSLGISEERISDEDVKEAWLEPKKHPFRKLGTSYERWRDTRFLVDRHAEPSDRQLFQVKKGMVKLAIIEALTRAEGDADVDVDYEVVKAALRDLNKHAKKDSFKDLLMDERENAQNLIKEYEEPRYEDLAGDEDF